MVEWTPYDAKVSDSKLSRLFERQTIVCHDSLTSSMLSRSLSRPRGRLQSSVGPRIRWFRKSSCRWSMATIKGRSRGIPAGYISTSWRSICLWIYEQMIRTMRMTKVASTAKASDGIQSFLKASCAGRRPCLKLRQQHRFLICTKLALSGRISRARELADALASMHLEMALHACERALNARRGDTAAAMYYFAVRSDSDSPRETVQNAREVLRRVFAFLRTCVLRNIYSKRWTLGILARTFSIPSYRRRLRRFPDGGSRAGSHDHSVGRFRTVGANNKCCVAAITNSPQKSRFVQMRESV